MSLRLTMTPTVVLLLLGVSRLGAQTPASDSAAGLAHRLSGPWRYSAPRAALFVPISLEQSDMKLTGTVEHHGQCSGKEITMRADMVGAINGRKVLLSVSKLQILDGEAEVRRDPRESYGGPCNPVLYQGAVFNGELAPNGKVILGTLRVPEGGETALKFAR